MRKQFNSLKLSVTLLPFLLPFFSVTSVKQVDDLPTKYPADEVVLNVDYRDEYVARLVDKAENEYVTLDGFKVTHYSPFCSTGCIGITKVGVDVRKTIYHEGYRVIAVDPRVIPLWSIVELELPTGTIQAMAIDTGGAIKGYTIDLLVKSTKEAYALGVYRDVKVKIIREGEGEID